MRNGLLCPGTAEKLFPIRHSALRPDDKSDVQNDTTPPLLRDSRLHSSRQQACTRPVWLDPALSTTALAPPSHASGTPLPVPRFSEKPVFGHETRAPVVSVWEEGSQQKDIHASQTGGPARQDQAMCGWSLKNGARVMSALWLGQR